MWTAGYDIKSNLIAQYDHDTFCALLAGRKTMTTLSSSGITIYFPGGTTWDGKYVALTDQGADDKDEVGIVQESLSGTTLTEQGESFSPIRAIPAISTWWIPSSSERRIRRSTTGKEASSSGAIMIARP